MVLVAFKLPDVSAQRHRQQWPVEEARRQFPGLMCGNVDWSWLSWPYEYIVSPWFLNSAFQRWFCSSASSTDRPIWVNQPMSAVPIFGRKNADVRFRCLVVYQNWTMTFLSTEVGGALRYHRRASDTEQTSVKSRHRRCWASADLVTHHVGD